MNSTKTIAITQERLCRENTFIFDDTDIIEERLCQMVRENKFIFDDTDKFIGIVKDEFEKIKSQRENEKSNIVSELVKKIDKYPIITSMDILNSSSMELYMMKVRRQIMPVDIRYAYDRAITLGPIDTEALSEYLCEHEYTYDFAFGKDHCLIGKDDWANLWCIDKIDHIEKSKISKKKRIEKNKLIFNATIKDFVNYMNTDTHNYANICELKNSGITPIDMRYFSHVRGITNNHILTAMKYRHTWTDKNKTNVMDYFWDFFHDHDWESNVVIPAGFDYNNGRGPNFDSPFKY